MESEHSRALPYALAVKDSRLDVAASATREGVLHAFPRSIRPTVVGEGAGLPVILVLPGSMN
jgi:hypothetical protein